MFLHDILNNYLGCMTQGLQLTNTKVMQIMKVKMIQMK